MPSARTVIEHLLAKGKLEAALEACLMLCRHYGDSGRNSEVAQHSARFHALMDDYHAGTISDDDYRLERARINRAMLLLAHEIPADWTEEALKRAGFSAKAYDEAAPAQPARGAGKKWMLVLGAVLVVVVLAIALKGEFFSPQRPEPQKPAQDSIPEQTKPAQKPAEENKRPSTTTATPPEKSVAKPSDKTSTPRTASDGGQSAPVGATDTRFRSFAKMKIADDMERGYMGQKLAFRNVRTKEVLCCYTDAEDFAGGRAYVSKDGVNYFYIDKKGNKVE